MMCFRDEMYNVLSLFFPFKIKTFKKVLNLFQNAKPIYLHLKRKKCFWNSFSNTEVTFGFQMFNHCCQNILLVVIPSVLGLSLRIKLPNMGPSCSVSVRYSKTKSQSKLTCGRFCLPGGGVCGSTWHPRRLCRAPPTPGEFPAAN